MEGAAERAALEVAAGAQPSRAPNPAWGSLAAGARGADHAAERSAAAVKCLRPGNLVLCDGLRPECYQCRV